MNRKLSAALGAVGVTIALVACSTVPDSGPVREGLSQLTQAERNVFLNPQGPAKGADQEAIVRGFVRASASNPNNYKIAREFLTPTYAQKWDPKLRALVTDGALQVQSPEKNITVLSVHALANVDASGTMAPSAPDSVEELRFELAEVDGEWRIASAPNGIIIDRSSFSTVWSTRQLFFLRPDQKLASEVRWFPSGESSLSAQIVRGLIGGPSRLMAGAVHTAFPAGTKLTATGVNVVDSVAVINCSAELLDADDTAIASIGRQVAASLQGVPGVTRFQLSVRGTVIGGGDVALTEEVPSSQNQSIAVLKDGQFGIAAGSKIEPLGGLSERVASLAPTSASVSADLSSVVALHREGVSLVTRDRTVLLDNREKLIGPSIDSSGYIWTYSTTAPDQLRVISADGRAVTLDAPWLEGTHVKAARVSMGGNRIAVLTGSSSDGTAVYVAGIVRDEVGSPVGFTQKTSVQMWDTGGPIDFDWISDNRYVLLSSSGLLGGTAKVTLGEVGGRFAVESGSVSGGASISGSRSALMRVLDEQGRLFAPQGSGWQQLLTGVDLLAKVG